LNWEVGMRKWELRLRIAESGLRFDEA